MCLSVKKMTVSILNTKPACISKTTTIIKVEKFHRTDCKHAGWTLDTGLEWQTGGLGG